MRRTLKLKNKQVMALRKTTRRTAAKRLRVHLSKLRWSDGLLQKQDDNGYWAPLPGIKTVMKSN